MPPMTHRITRQAVEEHTEERRNADGSPRIDVWHTYRTHCACGRVFATGNELMTQARYLGHLPTPEADK